jgi:cell division transport system ATP-binding protein
MTEPAVIAFDRVRFAYDDRPVLQDLSLSLEAGSLHFLTGRSGAGKTTLLKLVYFALSPDAGNLRVFGAPPPQSRAQRALGRRRMGLVLQDCELLEHMSLFDNIALPLRAAGIDPRRRAADIRDLARWVGLADRLRARPAELSSGERQRAAVARAVIATPEIVIADEPTGDVDEEAAGRILELFLQLHAAGTTVLIATHDLSLIRRAQGRGSARTLRLENGAIIRAGAAL